jgi:cation transport ATPase
MSAHIQVTSDAIELRDPALFGVSSSPKGRLFLQRALTLPEVVSVALQPERKLATVRFECAAESHKGFLERFLTAIEGKSAAVENPDIDWAGDDSNAYWVRVGDHIQKLDLSYPSEDSLLFCHPALSGGTAALALKIHGKLGEKSGIRSLQHQPDTSSILIHFNPRRLKSSRIEAEIVAALVQPSAVGSIADPSAVPMTVSTTTVGLSTVGELLLPVVTPVAAGVLIATNFHIVKDAASQLSRGKVGVPLFHTALLTCSIVTGQVLAFALTDWSLRYWQRRWRNQLALETEETLQETLPSLMQIRNIGDNGVERLTSPDAIRPGDRLRVLAGEIIPADGEVILGTALVDESLITGVPHPVRKYAPQEILAGSRVLTGPIEFRVRRAGMDTCAARIAEEISRTATLIPMEKSLTAKAEALGDKTALPTLATAGVGWMAGSLITVGAILHQDWVSGPYLAIPLVTLQHIREALALGAVTQHPSALLRLSEAQFLVLDGDDARLFAKCVVLKEIQSTLKHHQALLQTVAGASLFLGDARSNALQKAAAEQGLAVRQPDLVRLEPSLIEIEQGNHRVVLIAATNDPLSPIQVEIDGQPIAEFHFQESPLPEVADTISTLKAQGFDVFLMSSGKDAQVEKKARELGITLFGGELDLEAKKRFLDGLKSRGVKSLLASKASTAADLAAHAHVTIALETLEKGAVSADIVLQGGRYAGLGNLVELSRTYVPDIEKSTREALVPNLLCVAGAFGGLLNGITSGIIANIAVANVDRSLKKKLARGRRRPRLIHMAP